MKCSFERLGKKTEQLRSKKVNPKVSKKIKKDRKRRMDEWRKWWS